MTYSTLIETELHRAQTMTRKDHKQRWITMDGRIHETPVPFREAITVSWLPIVNAVGCRFKHALPHNPAIGAL